MAADDLPFGATVPGEGAGSGETGRPSPDDTPGPTPYYEDEHVVIYHGDCLELADLWTCADVLVTDPPYGRAWRQGEIRDTRGTVKRQNSLSREGIRNDDTTLCRDAALVAWGRGPAIVFGDLMLGPPTGTQLVCVYHKTNPTSGLRGAIAGVRRDAEAVYLMGWPSGIGGRSSVFATSRQMSAAHGIVTKDGGGHPHTKPDDVLGALLALTPDGASIADPFMGSGSTLVAAKGIGRRSIGVELEERYCEIAAKRCAQEVLDLGASA